MRSVYGVGLTIFMMFALISSALGQAKSSPGQETFKTKCALCHGADGTAKTTLGEQMKASNLRSVEVQKQSDSELKDVISHGKNNMPAFDSQLSADEVSQVVSYVRQLGKKSKAVAHPMQK